MALSVFNDTFEHMIKLNAVGVTLIFILFVCLFGNRVSNDMIITVKALKGDLPYLRSMKCI